MLVGHRGSNKHYYPSPPNTLAPVLALPQLHARLHACPARRSPCSVDRASSTPARSMKPSWQAERIIPAILSLVVGRRVDELSEGEVESQLGQAGRREH
jgi:hypothetical protein